MPRDFAYLGPKLFKLGILSDSWVKSSQRLGGFKYLSLHETVRSDCNAGSTCAVDTGLDSVEMKENFEMKGEYVYNVLRPDSILISDRISSPNKADLDLPQSARRTTRIEYHI